MDNGKASGLFGGLGIVGAVIAFFLLRRFVPILSTLVLIGFGVIVILILGLVGLVMYFALRKTNDNPQASKLAEATKQISQGRAAVMEIRQLAMRLRDQQLRRYSDEICATADKILRALREQQEQVRSVPQLFDYYLPTLKKILKKYRRLEDGNALTAETTQNTLSCLSNIQIAMEKLYSSLYDHDVLDLTAEMEVMTMICKRDGLLDEDF